MLSYEISNRDQLPYHLEVKFTFTAPGDNPEVVIPFWRPGRYETGLFPKNFSEFKALSDGKTLQLRKKNPNTLMINAEKGKVIELVYLVYARELTAGNTFSSREFLLINPVNSLVYAKGTEEKPCRIQLRIDPNWKVSTAMKPSGKHFFEVPHMQALMDTPLLCAPKINQSKYEVDEKVFHVHMLGDFPFDTNNLLSDFEAFTKTQVEAFGSIPVEEYHFLILLFPYRIYHGVEHENSTVIIYGPSDKLDERSSYLQLLGVSSHELYHTWNVKRIRPGEWTPYDFTGENFSRLGYVAEGVTTYMGDLMLWLSGVFSEEEFLTEMASLYNRHLQNGARSRATLADSSVDTWVDGYRKSMPRRKLNIYTEGALLAFICDCLILHASHGERSLISTMRSLYRQVNPEKGYTEAMYWKIMEEEAGISLTELREELVDGTGHWDKWLDLAFDIAGIRPITVPGDGWLLRDYGADIRQINGSYIAVNIHERSPAEKAGLWFDDLILEVNGKSPGEALQLNENDSREVILKINSAESEREIILTADGKRYGGTFRFEWKEGENEFRNRRDDSTRV